MPSLANPPLEDLLARESRVVCACARITADHIRTAYADVAKAGTNSPVTGDQLREAARVYRELEARQGMGLNTGGREKQPGYYCRQQACRPFFEEAAALVPTRSRVIMLAHTAQPNIGRCGNDCNTCVSDKVVAHGCTP